MIVSKKNNTYFMQRPLKEIFSYLLQGIDEEQLDSDVNLRLQPNFVAKSSFEYCLHRLRTPLPQVAEHELQSDHGVVSHSAMENKGRYLIKICDWF